MGASHRVFPDSAEPRGQPGIARRASTAAIALLLAMVHCDSLAHPSGAIDASTFDASPMPDASQEEFDGTTADGQSESGPAQDVWADDRTDASSPDADDATVSDGALNFYRLDSGLLGDGSCPSDLERGFVAGTEVCESLSSSLDHGSYNACMPWDEDGGVACNMGHLWFECRPWKSDDGAHLLLSWGHVPMGSFVCSVDWATFVNGDTCCIELHEDGGPDDFTYFVAGPRIDGDGDGIADDIDNCPTVNNIDQTDSDRDGLGNACDDCPYTYNPDQASMVDGGIGNACNCALPDVLVGPDSCLCSDGGAGT